MVFAKRDKVIEFLVFLFFILFPFGQLIRLNFGEIRIQPIDLVAAASCIFLLEKSFRKPLIFKYFLNFAYALVFSFIFSIVLFKEFYPVGLLYLIRVLAYLGFFLVVKSYVKSAEKRDLIFRSLITVSAIVGVFGWFQYVRYPDFRSFAVWGWDDHLYRLIGTFLDPTFTSIVLVFGFLAALTKHLESKDSKYLLLSLFFLITVGFTYTRAAYLALLVGLAVTGYLKKNLKTTFLLGCLFILIIIFLPRPGGEGVNLKRLYSVESRLENYKETFSIFKNSPLFGVGFNNLCLAKVKYLDEANKASHSCSGSDSSILLLLATTGTVGLLVFLKLIFEIGKSIEENIYGTSFIASGAALIVHSQFANSLFYPWVLGWMALLFAVALANNSGRVVKH